MIPLTAHLPDGQHVAFWTAEAVMQRLQDAARTLRLLPGSVQLDAKAAWPEVVRGFWEVWNTLDEDGRRAMERERHQARSRPAAEAIDDMDEALTWLLWLDHRQRRLLFAAASGVGTGKLARQMRVNRETIRRWKRQGLHQIVAHLNG